jgi:hypothetical protein
MLRGDGFFTRDILTALNQIVLIKMSVLALRTPTIALTCQLMTQSGHCPAFYVVREASFSSIKTFVRQLQVHTRCPSVSLPEAGDSTAVRLSAPGAVRHDVAHQVAHVVL